jgi:hypothetical protein
MNLWQKIDNFFTPRPDKGKGAAAAAAAAADIPIYVLGLITRPERAKDLIARVEKFQNMVHSQQAEGLIPLYLDLEAYVIENEPIKNYTKESLRLEVYSALNLKKSKLPFVGFFTPGVEGAVMLAQELFSKLAGPAFEVLGTKRVGEIILSSLEGTIFEGVSYQSGVLDFSLVLPKLKKEKNFAKEFKTIFNQTSLDVANPVMALRGTMPVVHLVRKKIIDAWLMLETFNQPAWQEQTAVIPITPQAREMMMNVGMGELITSGEITGVETELVPKEGKAKAVSVSASALKDETGNIQGMIISAKDLTQIKRLEQDKIRILEHAQAEAKAEVSQRTQELQKSKKELEISLSAEKASTQQLKASQQQQMAANQQLASAQKNLQDKLLELERFNKVAVGRELKMVELKEEIARLNGASADPPADR